MTNLRRLVKNWPVQQLLTLNRIYFHFLTIPESLLVELPLSLALILAFFRKLKGETEGAAIAYLACAADFPSKLRHDHLGNVEAKADALRVHGRSLLEIAEQTEKSLLVLFLDAAAVVPDLNSEKLFEIFVSCHFSPDKDLASWRSEFQGVALVRKNDLLQS